MVPHHKGTAMNSNHRCEVVRLGEPAKVPNADTLEVYKAFDWDVVAKQGQWKPGDLAAYVVPDSIVDTSRPEFSFLSPKDKPGAKVRVKVVRLRGVYSQGLLIPAPAGAVEGDDVAGLLGIERYDPAEPVSTSGDAESAPPGSPPVYDVESFRRYSELLVPGEMVVVTEKIHGANGRWTWRAGRLWCGSKTNWKRQDPKSAWWKVADKYPQLVEFLKKFEGMVVYGEVYGASVQDMKYGKSSVDIAVFDMMKPDGEFASIDLFLPVEKHLGIPLAPILYRGPYDPETIKALAEGPSTVPGADHVRKGCVVRPLAERVHPRYGRTVLKVVGNGYLSRKEKDDVKYDSGSAGGDRKSGTAVA